MYYKEEHLNRLTNNATQSEMMILVALHINDGNNSHGSMFKAEMKIEKKKT
jgi:hypothetical protein